MKAFFLCVVYPRHGELSTMVHRSQAVIARDKITVITRAEAERFGGNVYTVYNSL